MAPLPPFHILAKSLQLRLRLALQIPKSDKVDRDVRFLEAARQLDEGLFVFRDGGTGKDDDALALRVVLAVFEGELKKGAETMIQLVSS